MAIDFVYIGNADANKLGRFVYIEGASDGD